MGFRALKLLSEGFGGVKPCNRQYRGCHLKNPTDITAETLVLHSGPKFTCLVVYFYKYFWFWCQTGIVPEKVYAAIWPVLEITSLKPVAYLES